MYKIAVVGSRDTVMGFRALGLSTFAAEDAEDARRTVRRLARPEEEVAVIYLEESFADALSQEIERYRGQLQPAIILIPGRSGSTGRALRELHAAVERAVGSDILK
ncbi:MAG: V-type ATP synthase subunit F [Oscillospiraceae bacterium]|nr:V-type ATP synthase subunit F [Oscillospiraceae bacterium]